MIISILGAAGRDREQNLISPFYDASKLNKKSGNYHNSTHFILENYDDDTYLIGTEYAIKYQKDILGLKEPKIKEIITIKDNSLDDIFDNVYKLISLAKKDEKIILDITHGFRHQPISAIFSATLNKFLTQSNVEVIFAKENKHLEKYEYIYLNNYIDLTQLSLLLTGFIRTLNFINSIDINNFNTQAFENFSKALLSNDFKGLINSSKELKATISQAKNDKEFDHLSHLFEEIENILKQLDNFEKLEIYEKYLTLSKLMYSKNYYLLSLTYLFEAFRLYASYSFYKNKIIQEEYWKKSDIYRINSGVINYINQYNYYNYKDGFYDTEYPLMYNKNKEKFNKIANIYEKLRKLRNTLAHINEETSHPNIKEDLGSLINSVSNTIKNNILKEIDNGRDN